MSQVVLSFDAAVFALAEALGDAEAWFWEPDMLCHPNGARVAVLLPSSDEQRYGSPDFGMQRCAFALAYHGAKLSITAFGCAPIATDYTTLHAMLFESIDFKNGPILSFWKRLLYVNFSSEAIQQWQQLKIQCIVAIWAQDPSICGQYRAHPKHGFIGSDIHHPRFPAPQALIDAIEALRADMPLIFSCGSSGSGLLWYCFSTLQFDIPDSAHGRASILLQAHQDVI